jgi:hypothetical protein
MVMLIEVTGYITYQSKNYSPGAVIDVTKDDIPHILQSGGGRLIEEAEEVGKEEQLDTPQNEGEAE